jgi:hypothetical protein
MPVASHDEGARVAAASLASKGTTEQQDRSLGGTPVRKDGQHNGSSFQLREIGSLGFAMSLFALVCTTRLACRIGGKVHDHVLCRT